MRVESWGRRPVVGRECPLQVDTLLFLSRAPMVQALGILNIYTI